MNEIGRHIGNLSDGEVSLMTVMMIPLTIHDWLKMLPRKPLRRDRRHAGRIWSEHGLSVKPTSILRDSKS
jgi:hypothetical protein